LRYRILHNQIDRVLSAALRTRTDVVVARVAMPLDAPPTSAVSAPSPEKSADVI
jgi:sensor domain CHASE-containing protein